MRAVEAGSGLGLLFFFSSLPLCCQQLFQFERLITEPEEGG